MSYLLCKVGLSLSTLLDTQTMEHFDCTHDALSYGVYKYLLFEIAAVHPACLPARKSLPVNIGVMIAGLPLPRKVPFIDLSR